MPLIKCDHDYILHSKFQKELPKYKAHWNFIKSSTMMSMERTFGMLKKKVLNVIQESKYSIASHARFDDILHMFA
jgi:hypothetical protein